MTSSCTNRYSSFTLTQPFLGAPLQFQPALGSKELEELIDLYVTGSASKQNKLSEITIDFYNNATVDLNTGALTRTYHVASQWPVNAFEQSPISYSSGSSPFFTTSPDSSNFAGSASGSFSMTPPTNNRGRVAKKAKKETKKSEEIRLPGFSIMTKDGVDVTSSAGRGTKTKEQREHAHLMRIMKACPSCKRKKIRCDPSHRRSDDMTRTSTNNSSSSTSQPKPSPPSTVPSLTPQTSYASTSTPSFSPSNAIDDFVLFPEDTWSTDTSLAGLQTEDLGQFNFDINDLDQYPIINDPAFDFTFDSQLSNFQFDNNPQVTDQYGLDQWASSFGGDMPVHTRPHPSGASPDIGELDSSFLSGYLYDSQAVSPLTDSPAQGFSPDVSLGQTQSFQNITTNASPLSSSSDWSPLQTSSNASPAGEASTPASSQSSGSSQLRTRKRRAADVDPMESTLPLANARGSGSGIEVDPSDLPIAPSLSSSRQGGSSQPQVSVGGLEQQPLEPRDKSIARYAKMCQSSRSALRRLSSASLEAASLGRELGNVQAALQQVSNANAELSDTSRAQLQTLGSLLQVISTIGPQSRQQRHNKLDPEFRPDYLLQCQVQARRVVRSLCATINYVEAQNTGTSDATDDMNLMLVDGRNVHAFAQAGSPRASLPASLGAGIEQWVESTSQYQTTSRNGLNDWAVAVATTDRIRPTADLDQGRTAYRLQSEMLSQGISTDLVSNMASDGQLALSSAPSSSLPEQPMEASTSSSLYSDRFLDIGVQIDRDESSGAENSATSSPALDNAGGRASYSAVMPAVNDQGRPSDNVASSGTPLVSQLAQTTAATSSLATIASQQTLSYAAYQLALPLLATLIASYIASSTGVYTSLTPYLLIPLILSYLLPTPRSTTSSLLNATTMFIATLFSEAPLVNNLEFVRSAASAWIGTDPVVAAVKLTLIAVMTAQLPSFFGNATMSGLAVMSFLSQFSEGSSGQTLNLLSTSKDACEPSRRRESSSWLAAMRELSLVVVV